MHLYQEERPGWKMMALVTLGWYSGSVTEGIWAALGYPRGSPRNETLLIYFGAFLINCWSCNIVAYSSLGKLLECFGDDLPCFNYSRLSNAKDLDNLEQKFNKQYGNTVWNLIKGTPRERQWNQTKQHLHVFATISFRPIVKHLLVLPLCCE